MGRRWISRMVGVCGLAGLLLTHAPVDPAGGLTATITIRSATATSLAVSPPSPTTAGQEVTLTAKVTKAPGLIAIDGHLLSPLEILILFGRLAPSLLSGTEPVTGSVTFFDGSSPLGTVPLAGGSATLETSSLGVGTHNLRAEFAASGRWAASTSNVVAHQVTKIATTTALGVSPNPSTAGQAVTFTATISPSSATGSVEFFDGTTSLGSALVAGGVASLSTSALSVGSHPLHATYGGDATHLGSTSSTVTHVVDKIVTPTSLSASPNPSTFGQTVELTATMTPSSATGSVEFFDGATSLGSAPVAGGVAILPVSTLSVGSHSLTAAYSGDATHDASTSPVTILTVNQVATSTALSASPNPAVVTDPVVLTATVSPLSATGSVAFFDGATSLGSAPLIGGVASLSTSSLAVGTHSLTATYAGNVTHAGSTSPVESLDVRHPSLFMTSPQALCGTHVFDTLVVPLGVGLEIATEHDSSNVTDLNVQSGSAGIRQRCPVGAGTDNRGTLTIQARVVVVDGVIVGYGIQEVGPPNISPTPAGPVGNGGAGHAGPGGAGRAGTGSNFYGDATNTTASGGAAYGDTSSALFGHPGSPAQNFAGDADIDRSGRGGGVVIISASESVDVTGTISVDGGRGRDHGGQTFFIGDCGLPFIPDPDAGTPNDDGLDESSPFITRSGFAGDGGGSGGTIAISAPVLDLREGRLFAQGGDGGDGNRGGGGGGSGGTVKVAAPLFLFDAASGPFVAGGAGGHDLCAAPTVPFPHDPSYNDNGSPGAPGTFSLQ